MHTKSTRPGSISVAFIVTQKVAFVETQIKKCPCRRPFSPPMPATLISLHPIYQTKNYMSKRQKKLNTRWGSALIKRRPSNYISINNCTIVVHWIFLQFFFSYFFFVKCDAHSMIPTYFWKIYFLLDWWRRRNRFDDIMMDCLH